MPDSAEMPAPVRTTTRGLFILPPVQILPCILAGCRGSLQGAAAGRQPGGGNPLHRLPANSRIQGPPSTGWRPEGHRATKGSAARRVLFFKRAQAPCRRKAHCAEVRAVAAAPPRFLGLSLSYRSDARRAPGARDPGALDGNQKDIEPPQPPQHGACCSFKDTRTLCRRNIRCAEVRAVTTAPPRFLGPRFRGGNERGGNPGIVPAESPLR